VRVRPARYRGRMERWVALLRGVNVNGITIRSADLAALFRELGHRDVRTVLASGNVVFAADEPDAGALKAGIERGLRDRFGYDAWIVLVPHDTLAGILDAFPFDTDADTHRYVVFGSDEAALDELAEPIPDDAVERFARGEHVVYWACPKGSSTDTPLAKRAARTRFRQSTTTRNTNTLVKLL
jgi:uncharacterized protein (DUF1697 family)